MITGRSILFLAVVSSVVLCQASNEPNAPTPAVPQCAAMCMSKKISEAAMWFGPHDVPTYCQHPEFLDAYNKCLGDHCKGDDLTAGKQAGVTACAGVTPTAPGQPNPNVAGGVNATHPPLSGPANAPGSPDNSTLVPLKSGTNPGNMTSTLNAPTTSTANGTTALNGALTPTPSTTNATTSSTSAPSRFSNAVGSAAANASSQAGTASGISSSSAIIYTAFSSCLLSLML